MSLARPLQRRENNCFHQAKPPGLDGLCPASSDRPEMVSSPSSSSFDTCSVNASVGLLQHALRLFRGASAGSPICRGRSPTLYASFLPSSNGSSSLRDHHAGISNGNHQRIVVRQQGYKVIAETSNRAGIVRNSSGSMRCSVRSTNPQAVAFRKPPAPVRVSSAASAGAAPARSDHANWNLAWPMITLFLIFPAPDPAIEERRKSGKIQ